MSNACLQFVRACAFATMLCGVFCASAHGDLIVTLTENAVSTVLPSQPSSPGIHFFNGSTADFDVGVTASDTSISYRSRLLSSFIVINNSNQTRTLSVEVEDTWTAGAGFSNPPGSPLPLLAQVADPSLAGGDQITMFSGLASPVSNTPTSFTSPVLSLNVPGAKNTTTEVLRSGSTYSLFSFLTFTLAPGASENVSATTAVSMVPEPQTWVGLIALAGIGGLIWLRRRSLKFAESL